MYKCTNCKKFASIGPGRCWKCGAVLKGDDGDDSDVVTTTRGPTPPSNRITLRLRTRNILFVGAIDGCPEIEFCKHLTWPYFNIHITSYKSAPKDLCQLHDRATPHGIIQINENVNATDLISSYPNLRFDAVVWIGPTNDDDLPRTPQLVDLFVRSAGRVLFPGGGPRPNTAAHAGSSTIASIISSHSSFASSLDRHSFCPHRRTPGPSSRS